MILLETVKLLLIKSNNNYQLEFDLKPHQRRLYESAKALSFIVQGFGDLEQLVDQFLIDQNPSLKNFCLNDIQILKLRIFCDQKGNFSFDLKPYLSKGKDLWDIRILPQEEYSINSSDLIHRYKYFPRKDFSAYMSTCDEVIWLNEKLYICEGSFTNIFWLTNNRWYTPSISCGILAGTMRERFIKTLIQSKQNLNEGFYTIEDLLLAEKIYLTNSMIGVQEAALCYP